MKLKTNFRDNFIEVFIDYLEIISMQLLLNGKIYTLQRISEKYLIETKTTTTQ
jgi:hypothetical protein